MKLKYGDTHIEVLYVMFNQNLSEDCMNMYEEIQSGP